MTDGIMPCVDRQTMRHGGRSSSRSIISNLKSKFLSFLRQQKQIDLAHQTSPTKMMMRAGLFFTVILFTIGSSRAKLHVRIRVMHGEVEYSRDKGARNSFDHVVGGDKNGKTHDHERFQR